MDVGLDDERIGPNTLGGLAMKLLAVADDRLVDRVDPLEVRIPAGRDPAKGHDGQVGRRPDLEHLALSCENTEVELRALIGEKAGTVVVTDS